MGDFRSLEPLRGRDLKKFRHREVLRDVGTANKERFMDRMNLFIDGMKLIAFVWSSGNACL